MRTRGFDDAAIRLLRMGLYPAVDEVARLLRTQDQDLQDVRQHGLLWWKLEGYVLFPGLMRMAGRLPSTVAGPTNPSQPTDPRPSPCRVMNRSALPSILTALATQVTARWS